MGGRFAVVEATAADFDGAWCSGEGAFTPTVRTVCRGSESVGLLPGSLFQDAGEQPSGGGVSHLFHLGEVDVEPGSLVTEGASADNFPPFVGQLSDPLQILGGQSERTHRRSLQAVTKNVPVKLPR